MQKFLEILLMQKIMMKLLEDTQWRKCPVLYFEKFFKKELKMLLGVGKIPEPEKPN